MPFMHWVSGEPECGLISPPEYGTHGLTCYYPGTTNLIISVPHGGEMKPPFIADRQKPPSSRSAAVEQDKVVKEKNLKGENQVGTNGGTKLNREASDPDEDTAGRISIAADIYTQEMGLIVAREYCRLTGLKPHLIMCNLHRSKLDANRPLTTAAEITENQDPLGQQVYAEYHAYLESAKTEIGRGLLLDLHGQNHQQNSIELGYLYKRSELNSGQLPTSGTSVTSLLRRSGLTPVQLVTGEGSLGALLERSGYQAVPSPRQPGPGDQRYYRGGFITQTHGSCHGGEVDAIQMEVPAEIRHEGGETLRTSFSRDLAKILVSFMDVYYNANNGVKNLESGGSP